MYQKIQEICKKNNTNVNKLESDLGFPRGSLYKWDKHTPSVEKVKKVAEYFKVSIEELL